MKLFRIYRKTDDAWLSWDLANWIPDARLSSTEPKRVGAVFVEVATADMVAKREGAEVQPFTVTALTPGVADALSTTGFNLNDWIARHTEPTALGLAQLQGKLEEALRIVRRIS